MSSNNIEPDFVQVNVTVSEGGTPRKGFGLMAILSHNAGLISGFDERARAYSSTSEAITDGWSSDSPEVRALTAAFSQSPKPDSVVVLRSTVAVTEIFEVGAAASPTAGSTYAFDVKGQGFDDTTVSFVAAAPATQASINAQFLAQLNAVVSKNYTAAYATLPVVGGGVTFTADPATEQLHIVAHGFKTGDGAARLTTTTTLPAGLALATDYFAVAVDADHIQIATSLANALAGTVINITDAGTGVHTLTIQAGAHSPGSRLVVTGNATGKWFTIEPTSAKRVDVRQSHLVSGLAADLDEIREEDDSWYVIYPLYASPDYVDDLAAWAETNGVTMVFDTNDSDVRRTPYVLGTSNDIGALELGASRKRTMGAYHAKLSEMPSAAWMGRWLNSLPGKENTNLKVLAGVTANKLTTQEKKNIRDRRMNSFELIGGKVRAWRGTVFSPTNKWLDVTRNADWLEDRIATRVFDIVADDDPYTPEGVQRAASGVHAAFDDAISQGVSAQSLPNSVVVPDFDSIDPSDKSERVLRSLDAQIEFAGFIDQVIVNVTVNF